MKGQHALVVGASSGIGAAVALGLAAEGARVTLAARREAQGEKLVGEITAAGGEATFLAVDVNDTQQVASLVERAVANYGELHTCVNNAGIEGSCFVPTADYEETVFDQVIATNLKGTWLCMKYQLPAMADNGTIINVSSVAGLGANEMMGCAYTASKHGIIGLTRTAAREYAGRGIRINAVCPGVIETEIADRSLLRDEKMRSRITRMHPLGRLGTPEEVADAVLWMASERSSFMTGHALVLDGGLTS